MRFVVAQIGARRNYAVPRILEQAGLLECFYTDLAGNVGFGKWLVKFLTLTGFGAAAQKLSARRIPDSLKSKTVTFPRSSFCSVMRRALGRGNATDRFRAQLASSQALGQAMSRSGLGKATHLYTMLGECGPLVRVAKAAGLTCITEFYILLSAEQIVAREQRAFRDWEPASPDLDKVRREFPDQHSFLARTDLAICPSQCVRSDLQHHGFTGQTAVVPYGVDESWLDLAPRPQRGRVLFVGSVGLRKGIQYLAAAAQQLHATGKPYDFRIAGEVGPQIVRHPACQGLRFLGRIPRMRIAEEFVRADVFVLPTVAEGSAEVTYEALAAGLPVITTAAAGSVVRDGVEGCLVPERNTCAVVEALEGVIENRPLRTKLAIAARSRAGEYTLQRYGQRLVRALAEF